MRMIKFIALRRFVRRRAFAAAPLILAIVPSVRPPTVLLVVAPPFAIASLVCSPYSFLVAPPLS